MANTFVIHIVVLSELEKKKNPERNPFRQAKGVIVFQRQSFYRSYDFGCPGPLIKSKILKKKKKSKETTFNLHTLLIMPS